jgi:uncharacterized protein (DUF362 family)
MSKVVLASTQTNNPSQTEIDETVKRTLDLLSLDFIAKTEKVIIKPNLCYYWDASTGETTDPRVVSAVIDYVRGKLGEDVSVSIAEADASAMKTKYCFKALGYDKLSQSKKVDLINLSDGNIIEKKVTVKNEEITLPINDVLLQADLIINVPKLKTHTVAGVTCCMKNVFGAISKPRKFSYHNILSSVIVGVNKMVKSNVCLVDGIIARGSCPRKLGVFVAGGNPLTVDSIAAKAMGFNPRRVEHLNLAEKEKIGSLDDVQLIEDNVKLVDIKRKFPRYNFAMQSFLWKTQIKLLRTYARISGDIVPPVLDE